MDKTNKQSMNIPADLLAEKNYSGTRLIEVNDPTIAALREELTALQLEANPFLEKMDAITPEMDPIYQKIGEHQAAIKKLQEEVAPIRAKYDVELQEVEKIDQKATLIKSKIEPLVKEFVKDELGEFELAKQLLEVDGKVVVEVVDEIEEKIKQLRAKASK